MKKLILAVSILAVVGLVVASAPSSTGVTTNLRDPGGGGA